MPFPESFRWGVSTSAYQIEGAVMADGRGPSIWDTFSHTPGNVRDGHTGDVACDHYGRMEADVDLLAELGLRDYRFSIAWPRVVPDGRGPVNERGLDFYRRLVDRLLERGIEPTATLFHWDLPQALQDRGGWPARETVDHFLDYADAVWRALGDRVARWVTHNEPWMVGVVGHQLGVHAPGLRDISACVAAMHHLLLSHGLAVRAFRALGLRGSIGITLNVFANEAASESDADQAALRVSDGYTNRWFLDALYRAAYPADMVAEYGRRGASLDVVRDGDLEAIATPTDFLGVNYYARRLVRADPAANMGVRVVDESTTGLPLTDDGWAIHPRGLRDVLLRIRRDYGDPAMVITENGAVYHDVVAPDGTVHDPGRVAFLRAHVAAAEAALEAGVDLRGFFAWSFLDNFEWADGYRRRYGVVYVDFPTQRRIPKDSARYLAEVARRGRP